MVMKKIRLDLLLVERGLAESRSLAQRLVMEGLVRVNGQPELRSAATVSPEAQIVVEKRPRFVSRGGEKLEAAMQAFDVLVQGQVCADVGASTGGFTDCLLQHGATRVYAIDVGHGLLDWKLRQDSRVVVMEGTNARFLEHLPEPIGVATVDVSFISLKVILPVVRQWFVHNGQHPRGTVVALIKPQFEAGRELASRGKGVIRDPLVHQQVLWDILNYTVEEKYKVNGLIRSPLTGPKGNAEFLAWLECDGNKAISIDALIENALYGSEPGSNSAGD